MHAYALDVARNLTSRGYSLVFLREIQVQVQVSTSTSNYKQFTDMYSKLGNK